MAKRRALCEEEESSESSFLFSDVFTEDQLRQGAIVFHVLGIMYTFLGLAIICDDYFEPSLEALCENLQLTEDVAGATFMAAGGSAPELATSVIGVFFAKSDVGFGTIVGSAVFNVLFVIAICAVVAPGLELNWWPLVRDCTFYCFSILVLVMCVQDQKVTWWEALVLLLLYFVYVFIMKNNEILYKLVHGNMGNNLHDLPCLPKRADVRVAVESFAFRLFMMLVVMINFVFILFEFVQEENESVYSTINIACVIIFMAEYVMKSYAFGVLSYWRDPWNAVDGSLVYLICVELLVTESQSANGSGMTAIRLVRFFRFLRSLRVVRVFEHGHTITLSKATQTREKDFMEPYEGLFGDKSKPRNYSIENVEIVRQYDEKHSGIKGVVPICENVYEENEEIHELLQKPVGPRAVRVCSNNKRIDSISDETESEHGPGELLDWGETPSDKLMWAISLPLNSLFSFTIPDSSKAEYSKYYPVSFAMCVFWIAVLSYFMVFMATTLGEVLKIPAPVMGLTLLAGGTSIPDLLSSAAVASRGFGDMAVSSSIGSNIFDILIGLPLPWIVYTGIIYPGSTIAITSDGLILMVFSLLLMVGFVCLSINYYGWTLNINLAYTFAFLYILFVVQSLLLEYGVLLPTSC